jgi:pilus assembly protein CpaF
LALSLKRGLRFLDCCMYLGRNTLVSGGTGSGKTTMLNVLGGRMPKTQRLLIIEDSAELQIKAEHVVNFETRKGNKERGIKEVTIRDLMESALRLRPDRIIVGEVTRRRSTRSTQCDGNRT